MKQLTVSASDCSEEELVRAAGKGGLLIREGRKHVKVKTADGKFVTTIPRKKRLKRETVKGIVEELNKAGCNILAV